MLFGILSWAQLDSFWKRIDPAAGWYLYAVGEPPPDVSAEPAAVRRFIEQVNALLRKEHHHDYCGIVYADDLRDPRLVKIYDPNHLGASCGSSKEPPPPGWIMSRFLPGAVGNAVPTASRRRWWEAFLAANS
ncbi:MAG: hypothetical protein HYU77_09960 [Betaproteobacteria bacterium]|nr:hypothetical protein [Betaproteobacteria bacterium]